MQNERDRISCRRPSYEENTQGNGLSVSSLLNAEMLSRQVGAALEVISSFHFFFAITAFYTTKFEVINDGDNLLLS